MTIQCSPFIRDSKTRDKKQKGDKTFIETVFKNNTTVSDIENSMSDSDISGSELD